MLNGLSGNKNSVVDLRFDSVQDWVIFLGMSQDDPKVIEFSNRQIRALRDDYAAMVARQDVLFLNIARLQSTVGQVLDEMRGGFQSVRQDMTHIRSDLTLLENQNFSRHGEMLNVMRRLDEMTED